MRILVVDDDDDMTELIGGFLAHRGWTVDTASTVEDARRALRDAEYHVLVTDLHLPDGLGMSLLEPSPPAYLCAAILLTGGRDELVRRRSEALGFRKCLVKPQSGSDLVEAILSVTSEVP